MAERQAYVTAEGLERLRAELDYLITVKRVEAQEQIRAAQGQGPLRENTEYLDAKNQQAFVEGRILELERLLRDATVIVTPPTGGVIRLGSKVTAKTPDGESDTYVIVGSAEANPLQGRISNESPVGRALLGRKVGDSVQVKTPGGILRYTIETVE